MNSYYVHVYIDPRNLEEFSYSKDKGSRKDHELSGFDYRPGIYYTNVGEGPHRNSSGDRARL